MWRFFFLNVYLTVEMTCVYFWEMMCFRTLWMNQPMSSSGWDSFAVLMFAFFVISAELQVPIILWREENSELPFCLIFQPNMMLFNAWLRAIKPRALSIWQGKVNNWTEQFKGWAKSDSLLRVCFRASLATSV